MKIDAEALMEEVSRQVTELSQRCATLAGEKGALLKRVAELEAQLAAQQPMIGG